MAALLGPQRSTARRGVIRFHAQLRCATFRLPLPTITHAPAGLLRGTRPASIAATEMSASQLTRLQGGDHEGDTPVLAIPHDAAGFRRHVEHQSAAELIRRRYLNCDQLPWGPSHAAGAQALSWSATHQTGFTWSTTMDQGNHFSRRTFTQRSLHRRAAGHVVGRLGPKFDPANTTPMPAGSFVPISQEVHWDGAKDEDAVRDHG